MEIKKKVEFSIEGLSKNQLQKIYDALGFMFDKNQIEGGFKTKEEKAEVKELIDSIGTMLSI